MEGKVAPDLKEQSSGSYNCAGTKIDVMCSSVEVNSLAKDKLQGIKIDGKVFDKSVSFLLDTGAVVSLVNKSIVPEGRMCELKPNKKYIISATGQPLNVLGSISSEK